MIKQKKVKVKIGMQKKMKSMQLSRMEWGNCKWIYKKDK